MLPNKYMLFIFKKRTQKKEEWYNKAPCIRLFTFMFFKENSGSHVVCISWNVHTQDTAYILQNLLPRSALPSVLGGEICWGGVQCWPLPSARAVHQSAVSHHPDLRTTPSTWLPSKMQTKVIERVSKETLNLLLPEIMPGLIQVGSKTWRKKLCWYTGDSVILGTWQATPVSRPSLPAVVGIQEAKDPIASGGVCVCVCV